MKQDPHCYWCGIEVVYYYPPPQTLPDNFATLDHLNTRFDLKRWEKHKEPQTVLACHKCNWERGIKKIAEVGKEANNKHSLILNKRKQGEVNLTRVEILKEILKDE